MTITTGFFASTAQAGAGRWGLLVAFAALIGVVVLPPAQGLPVAGYLLVLLMGATYWAWLGYV